MSFILCPVCLGQSSSFSTCHGCNDDGVVDREAEINGWPAHVEMDETVYLLRLNEGYEGRPADYHEQYEREVAEAERKAVVDEFRHAVFG